MLGYHPLPLSKNSTRSKMSAFNPFTKTTCFDHGSKWFDPSDKLLRYLQIDEGFLSAPTSIEYPTEGGKTAFMNFYPPANKDHRLPSGQAPPLLVKIHGGPTSQASTAFNMLYQYWTSRGELICKAKLEIIANANDPPPPPPGAHFPGIHCFQYVVSVLDQKR